MASNRKAFIQLRALLDKWKVTQDPLPASLWFLLE